MVNVYFLGLGRAVIALPTRTTTSEMGREKTTENSRLSVRNRGKGWQSKCAVRTWLQSVCLCSLSSLLAFSLPLSSQHSLAPYFVSAVSSSAKEAEQERGCRDNFFPSLRLLQCTQRRVRLQFSSSLSFPPSLPLVRPQASRSGSRKPYARCSRGRLALETPVSAFVSRPGRSEEREKE